MRLRCGSRTLDLDRAQVMGVLNLTPDSFYDGGELYRDGRVDIDAALRRAAGDARRGRGGHRHRRRIHAPGRRAGRAAGGDGSRAADHRKGGDGAAGRGVGGYQLGGADARGGRCRRRHDQRCARAAPSRGAGRRRRRRTAGMPDAHARHAGRHAGPAALRGRGRGGARISAGTSTRLRGGGHSRRAPALRSRLRFRQEPGAQSAAGRRA